MIWSSRALVTLVSGPVFTRSGVRPLGNSTVDIPPGGQGPVTQANSWIERYTPAERSQHVLHYHPGIFDAFYAGNVSSCDGGAAFRNEDPDHSVPEYFRGIGQFRELGVPTQLPATMDSAIQQNPSVVELDTQARDAITSAERAGILTTKKSLKKLRREGLESYRNEWLIQRRKAKILSRGSISPCMGRDPDPLNELIPEKGRLAAYMARDSDLDLAEL